MKDAQLSSRDKWLLFTFLAVCVVLFFFIWQLKTDKYSELLVPSDTSVWDLRNVDMDSSYVRLTGGISEYVPEKYLSPEEFEAYGDKQIGRPKEDAEYYTARIRLLVPEGQVYAVTLVSVDYSDSIYINGVHMQSIGKPGTTPESNVPQTASVYYTVTPENGVIEVLHQSSNFVHREGGNPAGLRIGSLEIASRYYARQTLAEAIIMGCCLLLSLVHMALFFMMRRYRANLYFSLFCLTWVFRSGVTSAKTITALFPNISWYLTFRIEYIAIPLGSLLVTLALDAMFSGLLQKRVKHAIVAAHLAVVLLFCFISTVLMSKILPVVYVISLLTVVYVIIRFLLQLKTKRNPEHAIVFCALLALTYLVVREMLYHADIVIFPIVHSGMLDFAVLVFMMAQMTAAFYGTMREVASAYEAEKCLQLEAESLRSLNLMKEKFLGDVSHELKMPITVISGFAQYERELLSDKQPDLTELLDCAVRIETEADRMERLVMQLLDMAAIENGYLELKKQQFYVCELLDRIENTYFAMANNKGNALVSECAEDIYLYADFERILQVLINLVSNSLKYTENGVITLTAHAQGGEALLAVEDTGSGIDEALLPVIFQQQGKQNGKKGHGLGLVISKRLVEAHGGSISIASSLNKGTKVTVALPLEVRKA